MIAFRSTLAAFGAAAVIAATMAVAGPLASDEVDRNAIDALDAVAGRALFEREWVGAPASTDAADGLGPLFNAKSCNGCHRGGGAAQFVEKNGRLIARGLAVRAASADGTPHPVLGTQVQNRALPGLEAEGRVSVRIVQGVLTVSTQTAHPAALFETRIAPSLRGRGLLDDIDADAVMALADPDDRDGDGISGRARFVTDSNGHRALGRFGQKAGAASLIEQTAHAAALDMGLSSPRVRSPFGDCTASQVACLSRATGQSSLTEGEELSGDMLALITGYLRTLDAPEADLASKGARLFAETGCAACHRPRMPARGGGSVTVFSDLLLHDMGDESGSVIREGDVLPAEWRTAPLRDLASRNGIRRYLHDGATPSIADAIVRHGGEAAQARRAFEGLDGRDRQLLLDFVSKL
ncbi:di-heme oxidoredictase family protein [Aestuariivirga sp.]|uniref:di-heme oxidoredictase family protein n=1 Tax=Aestuariivirga sp. TaxID=2650926 RepID=UPI003593D210